MSEDKRIFSKTSKQVQAIDLLGDPVIRHIGLFGGSRSGKTFILIYAIIVRASKVRSRHLIIRSTFNSIKRSIWLDTMPKVLSLCFPNLKYSMNKTDYILELANGSQIMIAGLDTGDRVEKILGSEFTTIYFNECSQIEYSSMQIVISRLAEKNTVKKKVYYDFNPPTKSHWSYYLFIKKIDPIEDVPLENAEQYGSLLMNPSDNLDNIDDEYINLLKRMPEKDRKRFLEGEFNDESEGQAYYGFRDEFVKETVRHPGTLFTAHDFNVNPMSALVFQYIDNKFYIHDEIFLPNSDTYKMCAEMKNRNYVGVEAIPDSTGVNRKTSGKSDFDIMKEHGIKILTTHNPYVRDRVNNVNRLLSDGKIIINPKCKKLINDLHKVVWRDNGLYDGEDGMLTHISDCLGYACWKLDPIGLKREKYGVMAR